MTPLGKAQREAIIRRISFIEQETNDLEEFQDLSYETYQKDRTKRRNLERIAENIANAVIDIGKIVLTGEKVEVPGTYREVFSRLNETGLITAELARKLGEVSRTRNVLAHQYLDLKWEMLKDFIANVPAVEEFIRSVAHIINPD